MQEIWKDVEHYEWLYEISNMWRIKSLNYNRKWFSKILTACYVRWWYLKVWLCNKWKI